MREATVDDIPFMQGLLDLPEIQAGLKGGLDAHIPSAAELLDCGPVLRFEDGFFAFVYVAERACAIHTVFRPNGDFFGRLRKSREAISWLFANSDVNEILTQVHDANGAARQLTVRNNFQPFGRCGSVQYFRLEIGHWIQTHPGLALEGEVLCRNLEIPEGAPVRSLMGFILRAAKGDYAAKAMELFSRYAILYGIPSLHVESWNPLTLSHHGKSVVIQL